MGGTTSGERQGLLDGYLNRRDMFDGGGPGRSGERFEGGGLLSALANLIAKPLPPQQRQAAQGMARPAMQQQAPMPMPMPSSRGMAEPQQGYTVRQATPTMPAIPPAYGYASSVPQQRGPQMAAPMAGQSPEFFLPQMRAPGRMPGGLGDAPVMGIPDAPPRSAPQPMARQGAAPVNIVDEFEVYLSNNPQSSQLRDLLNTNPDAAQKLLQQWIMNGKKLPGM